MNQPIQTKTTTGLALLQKIGAHPLFENFVLTGELALTLSNKADNIEKAEFCTPSEFNAGELAMWLTSEFIVKLIKIGNNLLEAQFESLKLCIFTHPHKWLSQPGHTRGIKIASPEDVAAMAIKKMATGQRIYCPELLVLRNRFSFKQLFDLYLEKYPKSSAGDQETVQNKLFFS